MSSRMPVLHERDVSETGTAGSCLTIALESRMNARLYKLYT
jgi:hypothetical protein